MKSMKRLTAIALCLLVFIGVIPVMGMAGFTDPDSLFGPIFDTVSAVSDSGYTVDSDGEYRYLCKDGERITQTGLHYDGEDYYYVLDDSTLARNEKVFAYNPNGLLIQAYYYFEDDCKMRKDGWLDLEDGSLHYENGILSQGLTKIDDDYYFFELNRGYLLKDRELFVSYDNKYHVKPGVYTFDSEGRMTELPEIVTDPADLATATNVKTINAFSDNMMIQRDQPFSVWGAADASSGTVVVEFAGNVAYADVATDGTWKATFDETFAYSTVGQELTVYGADTEISFSDILIGDVYYVIGQSNVFYNMQNQITDLAANGGSMEYDFDDSRNIRFYRNSNLYTAQMTGILAQGTTTEFTDVMVDYDWMTPGDVEANLESYAATDATNRAFSALGYLFAYNMSNSTDIPIGVIEIDAAGYPIISFAPNELADKWGDDILDPATGTYHNYLRGGLLDQENIKTRFVYNHLINPLKHFSTAGIIWYQGESDLLNHRGIWGNDGKTFAYQFTDLMTYFRNNFGDGTNDFPVYMIELPANFSNGGNNAFMLFGDVRCEQGRISELLPNFHLVNSADFFDNLTWANSLHPYIKHKQAARLAKIVLADAYGIGDINYVKGPQFSSVSYGADGTCATVTFTNVGKGLKVSGSGLYGFEVCTGFDTYGIAIWEAASTATVSTADTVEVTHTKTIYGIRYHGQTEAYYPGIPGYPSFCANLANSSSIPASAFVDIK